MKITQSRLRQVIKEEVQKMNEPRGTWLHNEAQGWFKWREVDKLLAQRHPKTGELTKDLIEILQEMGAIIATNYSSAMKKYDMGSMDFVYDVLDNYDDELVPYRTAYGAAANEAEILDEAIREATQTQPGRY